MPQRPTEAATQDDLARRLETIETALDRERHRRQRLERLLIGGVLLVGGLGAIAASGIDRVVDVVQTRRLEILDDNDRVVMLASAARHGGRLDIWDAGQRNIARLTGNGRGGDFSLFDRGGRQVAGVYAAGTSARIEVNNPENGSAAAMLTANERGGMVSTADDQGRRGARMYGGNGRGAIAVGTPDRDLAILDMTDSGGRITALPAKGDLATAIEAEGVRLSSSVHTFATLGHADGGGRLELLDAKGKPRFSALADATGGRLETLDAKGVTRVSLGVGSGGTGMRMRNTMDEPILAFGEDLQGGGAFELSDQDGNRCVSLGVGEVAGRLVMSTREGKTSLTAGGGREGGRIDVNDREGDLVATMRGIGDGGRLGVASSNQGTGLSIDASSNSLPMLAMFTPTGRSVSIAATTTGGLVNLHDPSGRIAVAMGAASNAPGGIVSVRNDDGNEVIRAGVTEGGEGIIEVYNESKTRNRSLSAP